MMQKVSEKKTETEIQRDMASLSDAQMRKNASYTTIMRLCIMCIMRLCIMCIMCLCIID